MIIRKLFQKIKDSRECAKVRKIWILTLVYSKLYTGNPKSRDARTFDLLELKKTETGFEAISLIPYGLSLSQLEEHKEKLQDALNSYIEIKKNPFKPKIYIEIIDKEPQFKFEPIPLKENEFFIGLDFKGKPIKANLNITSAFLICGVRGSGKTCSIIIMLTHLLLSNKDIEMFYIQIKKAELSIFASCPQTKAIAYTIEDAYLILKYLNKQIDIRAEILKNAGKGIDNLNKYNTAHKDKKLNRLMVVVEEASSFSDITPKEPDYEISKACWNEIKKIGKAGRSVGVNVVLVSQRATKDDIDAGAKSQLARISFKQESTTDSINIIGIGLAAKLRPREMLTTVIDNRERLITQTIKEDYSDVISHYKPLGEEATPEQLKAHKDFLDSLKQGNKPNLHLKSIQEKVIKDTPKELVVTTPSKIEKSTGADEEIVIDVDFKDVKEDKKAIAKTQRDKQILRFMEQYGAMTTKQVSNIFYPNNKTTESCRKRLNQLVAGGILESEQIEKKKEKQYYLKDGGKPKSLHDIYVLNAYTSLINAKCKILEFKIEPHLMDNQVIPDAYIKFKYNGKIYNSFVEVDYSHFTAQSKIELLEQYSQENNQKICIFIGKVGKIKLESKIIKIFKSDFKFSDIDDFLKKLEENRQ